MTAYLNEDEQVEALKKWWRENGTAIIIGIVIGLAAIIGVRYWFKYQQTRALNASGAYQHFLDAVGKKTKDKGAARELADSILDKYKGTPYAALTALKLAKEDVDANKLPAAAKQLRWAMKNPGHKTIAMIARLRLARVLVAENKLDDALTLLNQVKDATFDPRFNIVRGDILSKQGKSMQAREAYQLALTDRSLAGKQRQFVEMKMDALAIPPEKDTTK